MKKIAKVECVPHSFENFKSPYLSKLSGKVYKTSQNSAFYHLKDYFGLDKKMHRKSTYPDQPLRTEVSANLILRFYGSCPFDTFVILLLPLFPYWRDEIH